MPARIIIMELQTNPHNPRTISKDAYEKLKASIERNPDGLTANKIAYKDGIIISGNQRYRAILELGLTIKPEWLKDLSGWTQEQIDEWVIQSNISAGEWDWDILANEWEADNLIDWGIDMPDDWGTSKELPEDIDEIPEVKTPVSKLGDLWLLDGHRVLCGDSTDKATVERLMDGKKADMVFTDPPYNLDFDGQDLSNTTKDGVSVLKHKGANTKHSKIENDSLDDFPAFISQVLKNIKGMNTKAWYFTFTDLKLDELLTPLRENGFDWKSILIWRKNQATLSGKDYKSAYEPIVYGCDSGAFYAERYKQEDVWDIQRTLKNDLHPTQQPVEHVSKAVEKSSQKNEIVVDVFLGSGSTLIACEQTDRICYGLELDPHYVDVICKRWQTLTGEMPILESTGETHDFSS